MIAITAEVKGLDELTRRIRSLGKELAQMVEEDALKRVARPIANDLAVRVDLEHRDTGLTADDITMAASREAKKSGEAAVLIGATGRRGAGRGRGFILGFLEFGTFRTPGYHLVARTFGSHKDRILKDTTRELRGSFKRIVARFARQARA